MYELISTLGGTNLANFLSNNVDEFSPFTRFVYKSNVTTAVRLETKLVNPLSLKLLTVPFSLPTDNLDCPRLRFRGTPDNHTKYQAKLLFNKWVAPVLSRAPLDTMLMQRTFHLYCAKLVAECFNTPDAITYAMENPGCLGFTPAEVVFQAANPQSAKSFTINCVRKGRRHIPYRTSTQLIVQPGRVLCNWFSRPLGQPTPADAATIEFILAQLQARYQKELTQHINTIGQ